MSKYNICKKCSLGLKRNDCTDEEYHDCIREYEEDKELDRKIVEAFLKPRTNYNNNM